jgi:hypothetical protein
MNEIEKAEQYLKEAAPITYGYLKEYKPDLAQVIFQMMALYKNQVQPPPDKDSIAKMINH